MVDYTPWGLEEFGVAYLANAEGTDIGKASAGSDEVEHMFGVFWECWEEPATEASESMVGTREWIQSLRELLDNITKDMEELDNYGRSYASQWRHTKHIELTPNQAGVLVRTAMTRIRVEIITLLKEISENFEE